MRKTPATAFVILIGLALTVLVFLGTASSPAMGGVISDSGMCALLLDRLEEAKKNAEGPEILRLYEEVVDSCGEGAGESQDPALRARMAAARGWFLLAYESSPDAAVEVYEGSLEELSAEPGCAPGLRIPLLDGLSSALESRVMRQGGAGASSARDQLRSLESRGESLRLREQVYGADSAEAVEGLLLLGSLELEPRPHRAEELAREALSRFGRLDVETRPGQLEADALGLLDSALRAQGRIPEADEVRSRLSEVLRELY